MVFDELKEFEKDVKRLSKKYRSLPDDLAVLRRVLAVSPDAHPPFSFEINDLGITSCVIKVKKIACRSLKGRGVKSGLRLVYAYFEADQKIVLIELYHKNEKEKENRALILKHFSS